MTTETKRRPSPAYTFSVVDGQPVHALGASALKKLCAACDVLAELAQVPGDVGTAAKWQLDKLESFTDALVDGRVPPVQEEER
jgi:hypothetical protein